MKPRVHRNSEFCGVCSCSVRHLAEIRGCQDISGRLHYLVPFHWVPHANRTKLPVAGGYSDHSGIANTRRVSRLFVGCGGTPPPITTVDLAATPSTCSVMPCGARASTPVTSTTNCASGGPPRHFRVRTLQGALDQTRDALQVRRAAGPVAAHMARRSSPRESSVAGLPSKIIPAGRRPRSRARAKIHRGCLRDTSDRWTEVRQAGTPLEHDRAPWVLGLALLLSEEEGEGHRPATARTSQLARTRWVRGGRGGSRVSFLWTPVRIASAEVHRECRRAVCVS